jgi:hypothetical protein
VYGEFTPAMSPATPAFALIALAALPSVMRAGPWEFIRGARDLEVITVTDVADTGAHLPPASPTQPQYYVAASLGYRELGAVLAGTTEPPAPEVIHLISSELATRGYLPATSKSGPPSLMLVYTWGTLNAEQSYGGDPRFAHVRRPQGEIVHFLGGYKVGIDDDAFGPLRPMMAGLQYYNYEARSLLEVSSENFYVLIVSAYDIDAAMQKKRQPPVWTTRIAAPALGFNLRDVISPMLAIGGAQFGRDTPRPVWINASDKFKPNVRLGELQLVEYLKDEPLPVADVSDTPIKRQ